MLEAEACGVAGAAVGHADAWARVRGRLKADLGDEVFSCWFAGMNVEQIDGGTVWLSVPSRFLKTWISTHYRDKLAALWQAEGPAYRKVEVSVRSAMRAKIETPARFSAPEAARPTGAQSPRVTAPVRQAADAASSRLFDDISSPLDPRYTFENFVEGASNRLALAAARQVADGSASSVKFNPLYIHSSVGQGKTHLLQALTHRLKAEHPEMRVLYLTAEHFMYRFVQSLQTQSALAFKEALRTIDLLVIDDMQFLHGKQIQQEFCHTVNTLIDGARQVIVAADRPPVELETMDERVRSRLSGGLLIEIGAPDAALRRSIVERRIALTAQHMPGFSVPDDVIDFIVRNVTTSGRDLEGAVTRLAGHNQLTGLTLSLAMAETTLKDLIRVTDTRRVKIEDIQRVVSKHYNVSKQDLLSSRRTRSIVWPRQIAMYLAKSLTLRSLPEIGRRFGGRDHTTVLHAVRKVEELLGSDEALTQEIEVLKRMLEA
ncbi:chromosomal replication initiator protein DnaA [Pleomorphomonas sp. NRK KF1]|uniref:chromosomal replication initiator protein DnaA n=1 Tax=Pleomorphomonas sp. NRK KF1 TaxID=2943000 RepID=UPI002043B21F|nr:chromosomal replication initiator protein DnaA [Pleomorphomonas sp. NRK KF1]MCM5554660.1 chromosomal replication initiator protein DnaA [Pleomorphomonas sp. NRK KF1]